MPETPCLQFENPLQGTSRETSEIEFFMLGTMGLASSIGLGITLFTRKDVVVDGDGSFLIITPVEIKKNVMEAVKSDKS